MRKELFEIADKLGELMPENQQDVIKTFKKSIIKKQLNVARIISDELVDFYVEWDKKGDVVNEAKALYDKTMEYYELNT